MTIVVFERRTGAAAATEARLPKHLRRLESESIEIMREVVADFKKAGDALFDRIRLKRNVASRRQGVLSGALAFSLVARGYDLEIREMIRFRDETRDG
jgi:sulfate adenylyltransferase subunit 2